MEACGEALDEEEEEGDRLAALVPDEGCCSSRGLKPFSCMTVIRSREHGRRSTPMARSWHTDARLASFTWETETGRRQGVKWRV